MVKALTLAGLLALAGCAGLPGVPPAPSACRTQGEASYACQIERYDRMGM